MMFGRLDVLNAFLTYNIFFFFFNNLIHLFIYFWLHWVFIAEHGRFSSDKWGLLFVVVRRLLIEVASLVAEHRL